MTETKMKQHRARPASRSSLDRRSFLRGALATGAAFALGTPLLDAMLDDHGVAHAGGEPLPSRFGLWFFGNGVRPEHWVPTGTGTGWAPGAELRPIVDAGLTPWVSVVSGCEIKTATHPHHSGMTGMLTGMRYFQNGTTRDTIVSTFAGPSVDVIAKNWIQERTPTPFGSLELGITRFRGTDEGTTFQHLSHNGPNDPNPSEYSPLAVYRRLFAMAPDTTLDLARQSVLDSVGDQIRSLQPRVSMADRARLERHYESVRAIELRLASAHGACSVPMEPTDPGDDPMGRERIAEQNEIMSQLCALALSCDLTRVFSMFFSTAGSGVIMWPIGAANSLHQINHDEGPPFNTVHAAVTFTMQQLSRFLTILRDTPDGTGNLLDTCSILVTSELTEGWRHTNTDYPCLIAGKGNGRLRGGVHHRTAAANTSHCGLTALRGAGIDVPSFGAAEGLVSSPFAELMT
jgi:hypothetical protein